MRMIMISEADAAQVKAILMTHAEMQDQRVVESMTILGRLKRDEADDENAQELMIDLHEQIDTFEVDCDNLKRIAQIF